MKLLLFIPFFIMPVLLFSQKQTLPVISVPQFKKDTFSIVQFGAVGDGKTLNTKSIEEAMHELNESGGGVVLVPAGTWLTGPIVLYSNVNLHLTAGATLLFTRDLNKYQIVEGNWDGRYQMRNQSPISASYESNFAITGKGIIDGNGDAWHMVKRDKVNETQWKKLLASGGVLSADKKTWYPSEKSLKGSTITDPGVPAPGRDQAFYESVKDYLRPNLVVLANCKNVLLEGVTFLNAPAWSLHPLICENLTVKDIAVKSPKYAENSDGIVLDSCRNVLIENSVLNVGGKGIIVRKVSGVIFKNTIVNCANTKPVIDVVQSEKIIFTNITYTDNSEILFRVSGDRSKEIIIKNTNTSKAKEKIVYGPGADEKSVSFRLNTGKPGKIIVAADGSEDFTSIQEAINSLPASTGPGTIYIMNGIYNEKIIIEKPNIILEGEDREKTIITFSLARDEWHCDNPDDWGSATMNVRGSDLTLKNLTITNSFGFEFTDRTIICKNDTINKEKILRKDGEQVALHVMNATRLKAINCHIRSFGGGTVNLIDKNGMWYFKDCTLEGGVEFYAPPGWAWAENCVFIGNNGAAAISHDGSFNEDAKTVFIDCSFRGFDGFKLGRYQRDAQFFLLNCGFGQNMKDTAIYLEPAAGVLQWGKRVYYYNCHREQGNDFAWHKDNLPSGLKPEKITVKWLFKDKWNPADN